ncbi:MAG: hypothetical protein E6G46_03670 [Actinobacteria bacterium]|nr:MAG: hypothetical protein E6G46_03670 [Actinomycetota bacterium]
MDQVRLPDLEVIRRYSIAVRREHAAADEVLEALQADVEAIKRALRGSAAPRSTVPRATTPRAAAARPAPRKRPAAARPAPRKRPAAKSRSRSRSARRG